MTALHDEYMDAINGVIGVLQEAQETVVEAKAGIVGAVSKVNDPQTGIDATRKIANEAKTAASNALPKTGGTLTGPLNLAALPVLDYSTQAASTSWTKNFAMQKATSNLILYAGGANASDTADLFIGRGLSSDKPFATLTGAMQWANCNVASCYSVICILQADTTVEDLWIRGINFGGVGIQSDSTRRKLTVTGRIVVERGTLTLSNLTIEGNTTNELLNALSPLSYLYIRSDIELTGKAGRSLFAANGGTILLESGMTGNITAQRYRAQNCGRILASGKPDEIPGTADGSKDDNSIVC